MLSGEASDSIPPSVTESKFSTIMPYLEESDHASNNVFLDTETSLDPHASPSQHITQSPTHTHRFNCCIQSFRITCTITYTKEKC